MAGRPTKNDRIINATLKLAGERGWREFSLVDVARQSKLPLSEIYPIYPDKLAILAGYMRRVDVRMLKLLEAEEPAEILRERLFDAIMFRFDTLSEDKGAIYAIHDGIRRDPAALGVLTIPLRRSIRCILEIADIRRGVLLAYWQAALALILARVSIIWLHDDTEDMARTMAALDKHLTRADTFQHRIPMRGMGSDS